MLWLPCVKALVVHCAVRTLPAPPVRATAPQPPNVTPPSLKLTVPVGALPVTVAVNVTEAPGGAGLSELATAVVVDPGPPPPPAESTAACASMIPAPQYLTVPTAFAGFDVQSRPVPFPEAMARSSVQIARDVGARLIAVFTQGGDTARLISKERPTVPVVAFSPSEGIRRRLGLYWGVSPQVLHPLRDTDEMVEAVQQHLLAYGMVAPGDRIVLVFGAPIAVIGRTNTLRVHQVT